MKRKQLPPNDTDGVVHIGRPPAGDEKGKMPRVSFCVDPETFDALKELEQTVGAAVRGRRSVVLRRLILEEYRRRSKDAY